MAYYARCRKLSWTLLTSRCLGVVRTYEELGATSSRSELKVYLARFYMVDQVHTFPGGLAAPGKFTISMSRKETPSWQGPLSMRYLPRENKNRIAVLPFTNISPEAKDEYFSDGMTEELIYTLSKIGGLRVIAQTSIMRYKGAAKSVAEIGRELNVGSILEGSVRKSGNKLRVTAQLVDVESQEHLWSEKYDRELEDVFEVQSDIGRRVAEALKVHLFAREKMQIEKKATENLEAYQLYLKGRYFWNKRGKEGMMKGIEYFERAIEKDPKCALAYVGLADCYSALGANTDLPPKEAYPKARVAAIRALEIDNKDAEVHAVLAWVRIHDRDWSGGESSIKQAIELNPSFAYAHARYGILLIFAGRFDEGIRENILAQELDPLSLITNNMLGLAFYHARRYDEAVEQFHKTLEMDQNFAGAHHNLGMVYLQKSMFEEAIAEFRKANSLIGLATAYALSGKKEDAIQTLEELKKASNESYVSPFEIAVVYACLGQKDTAFEWLEKAYEDLSMSSGLKVTPLIDGLRSDPRFTALLKKMGLEK